MAAREDAAKRVLEEERDRLTGQLAELARTVDVRDWVSDGNHDEADEATAAYEREQAQRLVADLNRRLDDVGEALRRIDAGEYGRCEVCGRRIRKERLEALPHTTLCVEHSERASVA